MSEGLDAPTVAGPLDAEAFQRRLDELNPAAMLVRVESRMSPALRARITPEDLWQETLLCAWRDRASFVWRGPTEFRSWLLEIAEHRIQDVVERLGAVKRDAGRDPLPLRAADPDSRASGHDPAANGKSPSSAAAHAEEAGILREALASLPELYREVLRLRLFEEWDRDRIARELGLSLPAVKHRIRLGAVLYREKLAQVMSSRVAGC